MKIADINKLSENDLVLYKDYLVNKLYSKINSKPYYDDLLSEYNRLIKIRNGKK